EGHVFSRGDRSPEESPNDGVGCLPVPEQRVRDDNMRRNLMGLQGDLDQLGVGFGLLRALGDPLDRNTAEDPLAVVQGRNGHLGVRRAPWRDHGGTGPYHGLLRRKLQQFVAELLGYRIPAAFADVHSHLTGDATPGVAEADRSDELTPRLEAALVQLWLPAPARTRRGAGQRAQSLHAIPALRLR